LLIKYIKSVLWRVAKCLSYIEEARCLKVKHAVATRRGFESFQFTRHWAFKSILWKWLDWSCGACMSGHCFRQPWLSSNTYV